MMTTGTETQRVLAEMLTENTGIHMMDSGGTSGRNWQQNQGRDLESFISAPDAEIVSWGGKDGEDEFGYVSVDLFHYLDHRVEYRADLTAEFSEWAELPENKDTGWLYLMEEWAESKSDDGKHDTFNSYNSETLISQTIQGTTFRMGGDDDWYVLLQIHGGADVRGGYTAPRVFRIFSERGAGDWYDLIWGWNSFWIFSDDGEFRYSLREGEWADENGDYCDEPDSSQIVRRDGKWIYKPTGAEVTVFADNEW